MITFLSFFLGLITGPQTIELAVSGAVATVEIRIDGETCGVLSEPPWKIECDFGEKLTGHRLKAIGRDARRVPVDVKTQLINVPRARVETELLLDDWQRDVPRRGQVIWHSIEKLQPTSVAVRLDGRPLPLLADRRFELPSLPADSLHFVSAEIELPDGTASSAEAIFGGVFGTSVRTELTAVPLYARGGRVERAKLEGWIQRGGEPLEVMAVGEGPAQVMVVRDEDALASLRRVAGKLRANPVRLEKMHHIGLEKTDEIHFLSTRTKVVEHEHLSYGLFPESGAFTREDGSLPDLLWALRFEDPGTGSQQIVEAVAVAGLSAAGSRKRRAVLAVVGDCARIPGRRDPTVVREFLAEQHVPLHVWTLEPPSKDAADQGFCAIAEDISGSSKMMRAINRLKKTLERQQVVWVDGRYLPGEIELSEKAEGVRLVR
ncbi:MAG: hypothetical protein GY719_05050 [bacterium]|nr:hypothetical protein [bacterium]